MAGEQEGLQVGQEADGRFFAEKGVGDFGLLALLPVREDGLAGRLFEVDGSVFLGFEIRGGELLSVDQGEGGAVGEEGAELFHEIEGEGGSAGAISVEEAALRVEADRFEGAAAVVHEEGIEKGEQGVKAILGRAARPGGVLEFWMLCIQ